MPYAVLLSPAAERDHKRLPPESRPRITEALLALEADPRPSGVTKLAGSASRWRMRVGDYRILFEVRDSDQTVLVLRIAHRRDVYR
ncbi:MAG: type II toxin-antitoxin system RelE/ParE family toxin [Armatimonadota bacterium]|nr:type II toxin-antitoxin system RelE/ParE family toxin [Armatimonadota bacterium]